MSLESNGNNLNALRVRTIPFDLAEALRLGPVYEWIGDRGIAHLALGYSFALEFTEHAINQAHPAITNILSGSKLDKAESIFNFQEANHAKYHKVLNEMLLPGRTSREKYHPRVYDFYYTSYKCIREPLMKRLYEPKTEAEQRQAVGETIFRIAAFESTTCITGLTFFEYFFEDNHLEDTLVSCVNPAILYLFGYHLAEELEHCSTAVDIYDLLVREPVWTEATLSRMVSDGHYASDHEAFSAAFTVAKAEGIDLSAEELQTNPFSVLQRRNLEEALVPGFSPNSPVYSDRRKRAVERWDNEWEPLIREVIEKKLAARA